MNMRNWTILAIAVLFLSCSVNDYEVEDYHYLIIDDTEYFGSYETSETIKAITDDVFDVVPLDKCSWINCKYEEYGYAYIHVDANETTQDRQCRIMVKNDKNNVRDTITAYQFGIIDTSNESVSGGGSGSSTSTSSRRCAARTKNGTRCKRTASKGSIYCWQHKK